MHSTLEDAVDYGSVDPHIKPDTHSLGAGPHDFPDNFDGLPVSHKGDGHDNAFTHGDIVLGLDKHAPAIDVGNIVDKAQIMGGAADFHGAFLPIRPPSLFFGFVCF